jgi:hypothetical protein
MDFNAQTMNQQGEIKVASSGGYPFDPKELTVDPVDSDAQYTTIAAAAAAAVAGDCIRVGAGTHTADAVDIPSGVDLRGSGKNVTFITTSAGTECLNFLGSNMVSDLSVLNTYVSGGTNYAIRAEGPLVEFSNVLASAINGSGSSVAWFANSTTCRLYQCEGLAAAPIGYALGTSGGNVDMTIEGGRFDGSDFDLSAGSVGDLITLNDPMLVNGTISATGTVQGCWVESDGFPRVRGEYGTWTPQLWQPASVGVFIHRAVYHLIGDTATTQIRVGVTAAGTAANAIQIRNQPAAIQSVATSELIGHFMYIDQGVAFYTGAVFSTSSTIWQLVVTGYGNYLGLAPSFAIANTDTLWANCTYRIA